MTGDEPEVSACTTTEAGSPASAWRTGVLVALLAAASLPSPAAAQRMPGDSTFADRATGSWGGARRRLGQAGLTLDALLILEGFGNFRGGLHTGTVGGSTSNLLLSLDTDRAFGWHGGELHLDLGDRAGPDPTAVLTGDIQVFDKRNAAPFFQIYELWLQQKALDGAFRVKLGKIDANTEFNVIENGLVFLNSTAQVTPTALGFPTFPDPVPALTLFLNPASLWFAGAGAFLANRSVRFGDFYGHPESVQPTRHGGFFVGETGLRWKHAPISGTDGDLKFGVWTHTGTFTRLDGGRRQGASGFYVVLDQTLWQPAGDSTRKSGVRGFVSTGHTQSSVSVVDWSVTGGLVLSGLVAARPGDLVAFGADYAHVSTLVGLPYAYELALELLYEAELRKWATLIPDLQYIVHPGGEHPDALVATLALSVRL